MGTPGILNYPTSLDDTISLFEVKNNAVTTLAVAIDTDDNRILLTDDSNFPDSGAIGIGNELIYYNGSDGSGLIVTLRGADGTTAAIHEIGVAVEGRVIARHHSIIRDAIIALETKIGAGTDPLASEDYVDTGLSAKAPNASPTFTGTVSGITKGMVGLGNVDNTADTSKPVSTAQQTALDLKAPLNSPTLTGTPAAPTASQGTNTTQIATTAFVRAEAAALINSAPSALDTLSELSAALGDDPNFATTIATSIGAKAPTASPTFTGTVSGITKGMVGLGNVDNTADTAKPVSTAQQTALNLKADLASPTLTGIPIAPTASAATNTTQLATTAFVTTADNLKANLASPTFTGTPAAPTASAATSTTQLATTAFVTTADNLKANLASPTFTGTVTVPTPTADTSNTTTAASTAFIVERDARVITASEAIAAGDIVTIWNSTGVKARKANATDTTKPAIGFANTAISSSASGIIRFSGIIKGLSSLTIGAKYWLSTTGGGVTSTKPSTSGNIAQFIGYAISATEIVFTPGEVFEL